MATSAIRTSTKMYDLSSGNSEDALDTDAYLEALIRKQNIPRTKDYAPEYVKNNQSRKQSDLNFTPQSQNMQNFDDTKENKKSKLKSSPKK